MEPRRHSLMLPNTGDDGKHEIVFYDWGPEDASHVVFCVHGLTRNAQDFDYLAPALAARGRRVLAVSMAGRGESAWLADPMQYHYGTYMADCLAILNNFHLRSVDWVGTSMGGIIGMLVAANVPGRIRKLVLNDVGTFIPAAALQRIYDYLGHMPRRFDSRAEADAYLREIFKPFGITDAAVWQHFIDHSLSDVEGTLRLRVDPAIGEPMRVASKDFTQAESVNLGEHWEKIDIPVLILRGEQSDLLDAETVSAMRATNPKAEAKVIPGVGHAPSLTTPEQIAIVVNWLTFSETSRSFL